MTEPVAWTLLLVGEHHGIIGKSGDKFLGHPEHYQRVDVYTAPPAVQPLSELEKDAAALLFALHDAWPYVHQWCTIESKRKSIQALMRKHGDFADVV